MEERSPVLLAYLAGVIDSDGSISIFRHRTNTKYPDSFTFSEMVTAAQTSPEAVDLLHSLWPGTRELRQRDPRWKPMHGWRVSDKTAALCVAELRPYLRVKARQADLVLALRRSKDRPKTETRVYVAGKGFGTARVSEAVVAERTALWREIRALNDNRERVE